MTRIQKSQNEECWTLSPNPTNTHSAKHEIWREGVTDIDDSTGIGREFLKKTNFPPQKKITWSRWANRKRQGRRWITRRSRHPCCLLSGNLPENLEASPCPAFKEQVSQIYNKDQESQICEGNKYPTIGVVFTAISMCISSMCPTTTCSVVKDVSTVTTTNNSLTPTVCFKSIWRYLHDFSRTTSKLLSFLVLRSHWNFVWHLIVVVCCAGSYLLCRPCRQLQVVNHHRYRNLTKQGWKCNDWDPEQCCNWQERGWIRHHPRCWCPGLVEGRRTSSFSNPVSARRVDSSFLVFSLSSHRYSYISLLFSSRFIDS